jgi:hypothetical protein
VGTGGPLTERRAPLPVPPRTARANTTALLSVTYTHTHTHAHTLAHTGTHTHTGVLPGHGGIAGASALSGFGHSGVSLPGGS